MLGEGICRERDLWATVEGLWAEGGAHWEDGVVGHITEYTRQEDEGLGREVTWDWGEQKDSYPSLNYPLRTHAWLLGLGVLHE